MAYNFLIIVVVTVIRIIIRYWSAIVKGIMFKFYKYLFWIFSDDIS